VFSDGAGKMKHFILAVFFRKFYKLAFAAKRNFGAFLLLLEH
jgi:hypothetical protein